MMASSAGSAGTVFGDVPVVEFVEALAVLVGEDAGLGRDQEGEGVGAAAVFDGVAGGVFLAFGRDGALGVGAVAAGGLGFLVGRLHLFSLFFLTLE